MRPFSCHSLLSLRVRTGKSALDRLLFAMCADVVFDGAGWTCSMSVDV
jgi:hypothetical protein